MRQKGERWKLADGREVIITHDLANKYVRMLNERGLLGVVQEAWLTEWLNKKDFPEIAEKKK